MLEWTLGWFGAPLVVKGTFLHFQFQQPAGRLRSASAPPILHAPPCIWEEPYEDADETAPPWKAEDDEAALREGRRQTLCETWQLWTMSLLATETTRRREDVSKRTLRHRVTLTCGGFAQTASALEYGPEDMFALSSLGLFRVDEGTGAVEIWCDDVRLELPQMKELLAEAEVVRELSQDFFFAHASDLLCIVRYDKKQKVGDLKKKLRALSGTAPHQQTHLGVLGDEEPLSDNGARLGATSLRPGSCVRLAVVCDA